VLCKVFELSWGQTNLGRFFRGSGGHGEKKKDVKIGDTLSYGGEKRMDGTSPYRFKGGGEALFFSGGKKLNLGASNSCVARPQSINWRKGKTGERLTPRGARAVEADKVSESL